MVEIGAITWLLAGAALFAIPTGVAVPPATWLALTFLLHAVRSMRPVPGMISLWMSLLAALAVSRRGTLPLPGGAYVAILVLEALVAAFPFAVDRLAAPKLGAVASTLLFPAAWVAVEFFRSRATSAATWGSLAYTQFGFLPLMQVSALVGIWGVTFLVAWFASTANAVWSGPLTAGVSAGVPTAVTTYAALAGSILIAGAVRVAVAPTDGAAIRVATLNRPVDLFVPGEITRISEGSIRPDERAHVRGKLAVLQDWFLDGSRREAQAGARLVAWPEQSLLVLSEDEAAFLERARNVAVAGRASLVMGLGTIHLGDPRPFENKLVVIDQSGRLVVSYRKVHPVVGWEAGIMKVGDGPLPVVEMGGMRVAGAICLDADYADFMRGAGRGAAGLLVVPANEWRAIKRIHYQMAAFRAVENGVTLVRPAASGISSVVDPWGRVLGVTDYFSTGDRTLIAQAPVAPVRTLYPIVGDLFAWLCVAALAVMLGIAAFEEFLNAA